MDEEPKQKEESWAVEPPKDGGSKKRKSLRVALIVAALAAAVAVGVVFYGSAIRDEIRKRLIPQILGGFEPAPEVNLVKDMHPDPDYVQAIHENQE